MDHYELGDHVCICSSLSILLQLFILFLSETKPEADWCSCNFGCIFLWFQSLLFISSDTHVSHIFDICRGKTSLLVRKNSNLSLGFYSWLIAWFRLFYIQFLNVWGFWLHVYLCTTSVLVTSQQEEGGGFPKTGITDCCERPCVCWKLNPSAWEEQPVHFTMDLFL